MPALNRNHSAGLRIVRSHLPIYRKQILKEYTRLFNVWRPIAKDFSNQPEILSGLTTDLFPAHSEKLKKVMVINDIRIMKDIHKFQMNILGIKSDESDYALTRDLIPGLARRLATEAVSKTVNTTQTIYSNGVAMVAEGDTPAKGIKYVQERAKGGVGERRATNMADDQAHKASQAIIQAIGDKFQSTGRKAWKTWNTRRDGKVRSAHRHASGQTVRMNEDFKVGGETLRYPGDPNGSAGNTINCRCFIIVKRRPGKKAKK